MYLKVSPPNRLLFNEYCREYGFTKQDYNKNFQFEGKTMRFYGFNPKARKYHCLAQNIRTKEELRYIFGCC